MKTKIAGFCVAVALVSVPVTAQQIDQAYFLSFVQEYQNLCGRMIAEPKAFHQDPRASFGIAGEVEFYQSEDRASIDYYVETDAPNGTSSRSYGIVSVEISGLLEQSCHIVEYSFNEVSSVELAALATTVRTIFEQSPDFEIVGGKYNFEETTEYFFAVTGLFAGEDIITQITFGSVDLSIEHIHISEMR